MELFITDAMAVEFEILSGMIVERTSSEQINDLYREIQRDRMIDNSIVVTLEKDKVPRSEVRNEYDAEFAQLLPHRIRVRDTLLDDASLNKKIQRTRKLAADF